MSVRKIIIILFILTGLLIECIGKTNIDENLAYSSKSPVKKITKIQGNVNQAMQTHVSLSFYRDYISLDQASFQIPIDVKNQFAMEFLLAEPTICLLHYNNTEIQLFLEPGDELVLNFEDIRPAQTLKFSGKGAKNNKFLHYFQEKFKYWNSNYIAYEMLSRSPMSFRRFMNALYRSKWNFYQNYKQLNGAPFTKHFHHYMAAEIDYWWAYNLLLYQVEHPLSNGLESPMELPENYFDFLKNVLVSNDQALNNRNYLYFLDQYTKLMAHPVGLKSNQLKTIDIVVDISNMLLLKSPDKPPILEELSQGTRLRYLNEQSDFQSQTLVEDVIQKAYWYKVKTPSGEKGWVLGVGIHFEEEKEEQLNGPQEATEFQANSKYKLAQKHLKAKARYFTQANDLYWRSHIESSEELLRDVSQFLEANKYPVYDKIIYSVYADKLKDIKEDFAVSLDSMVSFSIIDKPRILSQQKVEKSFTTIAKPNTTQAISKVLNRITAFDDPMLLNTVLDFVAKLDRYKKDRPNVDPSTAIASVNDRISLSKEEASVESRKSNTVPSTEKKDYIDLGESKKRKEVLSYLKGETENGIGTIVKLVLYSDPIQFNENAYEIIVSSSRKNKSGKAFKLSEATIGFLEYQKERFEIYLEPGDTLNLKFHPNDFLNSLKFTGKGSQHNNYLLAQKRNSKNLKALLKQNMKGKNHEEFSVFMKEARAKKLKLYESFVATGAASESFLQFAKADIDYWYAFQLMNYPWEHPLYNEQDAPMQLPESYYSFIEEIPTAAKGALPNKFYTYYLSQLFDYLLAKPGNEGLNELELSEKYLSGESYFYYRAKTLSMACKRGNAKESGLAIQDFIKDCPFELYNEILREVYLEAKGLSLGDVAPDFSLTDINGRSVNLSDFEGKLVYLDFWASWCSPCIMQLRNSRQWKKKLEKEEVVFLYVSLDKDKNAWRNFLRNEKLEGVHLVVPEASAYQSPIARKYKVKRLPAYYLIDKTGKVQYTPNANQRKMKMEDRIWELLSKSR